MIFRKKLDPSSAAFFEKKYKGAPDPWNFQQSTYEQARYDAVLAAAVAAAHGRTYARGFEPGCSIGTLTERLITVCEQVEAIDFAASAIATARQRCPQPEITFRVLGLPERLPLDGFDLVVLSEIGYYFTPQEWARMVQDMASTAAPGTIFVASHWLGQSPDHRMHGDEVHTILRRDTNLHLLHEERHAGFRLDTLERGTLEADVATDAGRDQASAHRSADSGA